MTDNTHPTRPTEPTAPPGLAAAPSFMSVVCLCGRVCKGDRGLVSHQRYCRTVEALRGLDPTINRKAFNMQSTEGGAGGADGLVGGAGGVGDVGVGEAPVLDSVVCLRLPRSNEDWATAHHTS